MEDLLILFKALSEKTRLRILKLLEHGELCVCDIVAALNMIQPKVSFHLGVLKDAGLIRDRKQGKWIHYSLDDSEMFKRFLILSIIERISDNEAEKDRERLRRFLTDKQMNISKANGIQIKTGSNRCGRRQAAVLKRRI